jgi:hypothetical protein
MAVAIWLLVSMLLMGASASAQRFGGNELGLTLGVESVPDRDTALRRPLTLSNSVVFGANFAHRLRGGYGAALYLEFPFAAVPSHEVTPVGPTSVVHLASLYVTPSLRFKLFPLFPVSPWISAGVGYGLYEGSEKLADGTPNTDRHKHTGVAQFGAGVDVKTPLRVLVPIALRGEFRDFYSFRSPNYNVPLRSGAQHNFVLSGGLVLRF